MKIAQTLFPLKLTEGSPTFFVARLREGEWQCCRGLKGKVDCK